MMEWQVTGHRAMIVSIALIVASVILRPQLASALVTRGDDLRLAGNSFRALTMYERALAIDPGNGIAADRFVFTAMMSHVAHIEAQGIDIASRVLDRDPGDDTLRYDRALCAQVLREYAVAAEDFEIVGRRVKDSRALTFAAFDLRRTNPRRARTLLRMAVAIDPGFIVAREELARSASWKK